jgi:hypothetical protein
MTLLHPSDTVMDANIAAALHMAARGQGRLYPCSHCVAQRSDAASCHTAPTAIPCSKRGKIVDLAVVDVSPEPARHTTAPARKDPFMGRSARHSPDSCAACMRSTEYVSGARVVLLGHGADEVFGGYGRYRTRFREGGWEGLAGEMGLDMQRLWRRNLGRDDRIIADVSRESRHPFLDEHLLQVLAHQSTMP